MRKAYVVGNCQVKSLAFALNYVSQDVEFEHVQVHSLHPSKAEAHIATRIAEIRADGDLVLAFRLSDKFFGLAADEIAGTFDGQQVLTISNLYFGGYHPDIVVLGTAHKRVEGPLDQYRSRIALYGYMHDMSVDETIGLYNADTYEALGYFREWDNSLARLATSDEAVDVKFVQQYATLLRSHLSMYMPNHPTPVVFGRWAQTIVADLAERGLASPRDWTPQDSLLPALFTDTSVFPVYPEIATHHGMAFPGSYIFKAPGYTNASFLTLESYLRREFQAFEEAGRAAIEESSQWAAVERRCAALLEASE